MGFPEAVKTKALIACARHCCLCHQRKGLKIECHHIVQKSEGGDDTLENCIPLCFDCHADMRSIDHKHPRGTKYTPQELIQRRDAWYRQVISAGDDVAQTDSEITAQDAEKSFDQYALRVETGETGGFFETRRAGNFYTHTRILKLKVANLHPINPIVECKVHLLDIVPREYDGPWILAEDLEIAAGDYKFVPLVSYTEADNVRISPYGDSFMEILANKNRPLPSADFQHVLTIRATALNTRFFEMKCQLWVDEDGRLRIVTV